MFFRSARICLISTENEIVPPRLSSFHESTGAPAVAPGRRIHAPIDRRKYGRRTGSETSSGIARVIRPDLSTRTQYRIVKGPLNESADQGLFCGMGAASTWSIGIEPSEGGGMWRLSSHSASGFQSNGFGIGVDAVIGVSVIDAIFGVRNSTSRSTRYAPQVSIG